MNRITNTQKIGHSQAMPNANEISWHRKARAHPPRRAVPPAGPPDLGPDRDPPTTFYRWYDRYVEHGPEGLDDRPSRPSKVWNRIPDAVRDRIVALALQEPDLSPRALAVRFTDTERYFVSEASVYRLLKSYDLITSPAYVVVKGETISATVRGQWSNDEFRTRPPGQTRCGRLTSPISR